MLISNLPAMPQRVRRSQGFTLVELLISMTIGLVLIAALGIIMTRYETSKRRSTTTADLAMSLGYVAYDLDRQLRSAGSGFMQNDVALGCTINASIGGAAILPSPVAFPAPFAAVPQTVSAIPLIVYPGIGNGGSDVIQVLTASAGLSEAPQDVLMGSVTPISAQLNNTLGIRGGDLLLVTDPAPRPCMIVQVAPGFVGGAGQQLNLGGSYFNAAIPPNLMSFGVNSTTVSNLGNQSGNIPRFQLIGINAQRQLVSYDLLRLNNMPGAPTTPVPLAEGVVDMRVRYGISAGSTGVVSDWVAPNTGGFTTAVLNAATGQTSPARQIVALRVALLLRGDRIENTQVSPTSFALFRTLPAAAQMTVNLPAGEELRNYKLVEFTVPLRNAIFGSQSRVPPP
jgi:type IV pilus assembly protein PilW